MSEELNFAKHLQEIIGKPLIELGFKQKEDSFYREKEVPNSKETFLEWVDVQRNYRGRQDEFAIRLWVGNYDVQEVWLRSCEKIVSQSCYDFMELDTSKQNKALQAMSEEHSDEVFALMDPKDWQYKSEDELKKLMATAISEIYSKGFQFFSDVSEIIGKDKSAGGRKKKIAEVSKSFKKLYYKVQ
jgi:hypothetical protein